MDEGTIDIITVATLHAPRNNCRFATAVTGLRVEKRGGELKNVKKGGKERKKREKERERVRGRVRE